MDFPISPNKIDIIDRIEIQCLKELAEKNAVQAPPTQKSPQVYYYYYCVKIIMDVNCKREFYFKVEHGFFAHV